MPARAVTSNQQSLHERLLELVRRHLDTPFQKPFAQHSLAALAAFRAWRDPTRPLVLDSCCGVGESTALLAARHPGAQVLGVDKSAHRLAKHRHGGDEGDLLLLRADLNDLWRLLAEEGVRPSHHYLLYPNPWPKAAHLQRRWHGGPGFPALLALGGQLQLRSNWLLYVEEFAAALELAGIASRLSEVLEAPITPFERKYLAAGQQCWRLDADLSRG
ncbi:SAM-dependent methyltransferase [Gallaecimonas kandeliae]|uniref:tRNA (guanine(46)-N(7))-methyltransferase TrmB n=1 Tax=Gallaecimonas kandeliae TaxID=3029055 RepID=UPI002649754F|nr:SAM-dependent methyltransferase [Gallaecimonas kandeliae]WKE66304.1 SAM-dependent methyltransferase [Gallaecimonas kandeliae]